MTRYLSMPYLAGGRTPTGADCWGLVRMAREEIRGDSLPMIPGVDSSNPPAIHAATVRTIAACDFRRTADPRPGAIAVVKRGGVAVHVGIVVSTDVGLAVLDTSARKGPRWLRKPDYERLHGTVLYYDD